MVKMKRRSICEEEKGSDHGDPDTSKKDNDIKEQRIKAVLDSLSQAVSGLLDSMATSTKPRALKAFVDGWAELATDKTLKKRIWLRYVIATLKVLLSRNLL